MKKYFLLGLIGLVIIFGCVAKNSFAQEDEINLYFFWGQGCPHCAQEELFLKSLESKYPSLKVYSFEIYNNKANRDLLIEIGEKLEIDIPGVPIMIINDEPLIGYHQDETTGQQIEELVLNCLNNVCSDSIKAMLFSDQTTMTTQQTPPTSTTTTTLVNQEEIKAYLFWTDGCPLCAQEKNYLDETKDKYPNLNIVYLNTTQTKNAEILKQIIEEFGIQNPDLPLLVIGEKIIIGWHNEEVSGKMIEESIKCYIEQECPDLVESIITRFTHFGESTKEKPLPDKIKIPLIGEVKTKDLSLPVLSIVLGGLDGFNPCAMWVLVFLISFLIKIKDRKKMWILGFTFIIASAFVYFLFMAAWLNLILFLGFIFWIRLLIGLVAISSGIYNLRDYFINPDAACKATNVEQKKSILDKVKSIVHKKSLILSLIGIILLAGMVNLIELVCSIGFPVVFTQTLALSNLTNWQYYSYMLLYIFIFMLDDLIVFIGAMLTLKVTGLTNKYTRLSYLIGGILMLLIGILMIFKPELLMFA
ncbi:MAG: hypothetical protein PHH35_00445 [Candidatus Pacebacteria bacterium]|nr:hypothetical protein [Candidatus Paceibacterota bacterium]